MVYPKLACIIVVVGLISLIFMYECDSVSYPFGSYADNIITAFDSEKVNVSVYYESLCIPCATFIVKNLQELFFHEIITIVNLHFVPWANSHLSNNSIICQNGKDECMLNSLEACAIKTWNVGRPIDWKSCINELGLPIQPLMNCYNNIITTVELEKAYINETAQLSSPPTILPWVLVNNQPVGKDYENIISYICKAYQGITVRVPTACNLW